TNSQGEELWSVTYGERYRRFIFSLSDVLVLPDGGYALIGTDGFADFWLVRLAPDTVNGEVVTVPFEPSLPSAFILVSPYPNPFNNAVNLKFSLPQRSLVSLSVCDLSGREVARLWDRDTPAGSYTINWQAAGLPSGTYFAEIAAQGSRAKRKLVLVK
ncbi:MAG: T9SS type A sorting domain-containing protein, partial [Calditrichota bacterium]